MMTTKNFSHDLFDFMSLIESDAAVGVDEANPEKHLNLVKGMNSPSFAESHNHVIIRVSIFAEEEEIICRTTEDDWFAFLDT
jgi:hypothetical protein